MRTITLAVFFSLFLCCAHRTLACSCVPLKDNSYPSSLERLKERAYDSDTIFLGKATKIEETSKSDVDPEAMLNVTFLIERVWADSRWDAKDYSVITIRTHKYDGMCGFHFEVGERYWVFAKHLETHLCTPTSVYDEKLAPEYFKLLGKGSEPEKPAAQDPPAKNN